MKSDVTQVSTFADFKELSEIQGQQLRRVRRRHGSVVVVIRERILYNDVAGDFFDFVKSVFDRVPEGSFRWNDRRRR